MAELVDDDRGLSHIVLDDIEPSKTQSQISRGVGCRSGESVNLVDVELVPGAVFGLKVSKGEPWTPPVKVINEACVCCLEHCNGTVSQRIVGGSVNAEVRRVLKPY